jgi:alpha-mannosidase
VELEFGGLKPTDGVVDEAGRPIRMQPTQSYATVSTWRSRMALDVDLPPLGYRTYRVMPDTPRPADETVRATPTGLENERVAIEVDPATGAIVRLAAKRPDGPQVDIADPNRARAVVVDDTSDTWGHRRLAYRDEVGAFEATGVTLVESGPVRAILRVESRYGESRLTEDYVLAAGDAAIEVRVILDWREPSRLLKLRYPTRIEADAATYEIPYGTIDRPTNGEEEPAQRWVDLTGRVPGSDEPVGLAILNDGKYGFDVVEGSIGVTAVRSPIFAHHEPASPRPGVRYAYQDLAIQRFRLALLPHLGDWPGAGLARRAALLNQPAMALLESFHGGDLPTAAAHLELTPDNVALGALKGAEEGDGIVVRIVETAGRRTDAHVELAAWGRDLTVDLGAFEIRTFLVPMDPAAAITEVDLLERPLATD